MKSICDFLHLMPQFNNYQGETDMAVFKKTISRSIELRTDPVDGFVFLRSRWEGDPQDAFHKAIVFRDDVKGVFDNLKDPKDLVNASFDVVPDNEYPEAWACLIKKGVDKTRIGNGRTARDNFIQINSFSQPLPDGEVVFHRFSNNTFYSPNKELLNGFYSDSIS